MAESVVTFLLNELSTIIHSQNINLGGGLQRQVQFIRDELGSMTAFLRYAEAKEDDVYELQEWVKQVREVACDTEDVLDEFTMRFACRSPDGFYGRVHKIYSSIKNLRARHQIASKIEDIKSRVQDISARNQRYQPVYGNPERGSSSVVENVESHIRGNALLLDEARLVGIAEPKRQLISHILDENSNLKAVSVVGMGGLGKTTLVRRVYEDADVKGQFQIHAWLTISQTFHMKAVLKDLIHQLYNEIQQPLPQEVESMDGDNLRAFVKNFLQERRYIIVLDDLWKLESWEAIRYAFPDVNRGNRILLTTRIADTAFGSCIESHDYVHKMKALSVDESWTLFCSKTFGNNCCPHHLEDVSRRLLGKCKGLPLAIVSISGVLALKSNVDEWEMILRSLGGELEGTGKLDRVNKILLLSYNDLPFFLKTCLLYISIYPEDWKISVEFLIQQWIAEGFVLERGGMTIVEVAKGYLNELVNRSLIQVVELDSDGSIKYCRIHDIVREIILKKSREQNFVTVAASGDCTRLPANIRRLAIHGFIENNNEYNRFRHLRSLVLFGYRNPLSDATLSKLLSGGPRLLKVLDLEGAEELKHIPNEIFKLFHLKYLTLKKTGVEIIPQSIGKLQNLEYLNLGDTNVMELPIGILKLRKLRELRVYRGGSNYSENYAIGGFKAPHKIGKLHSLEGLHCIDADNDEIVREIGKLTQLRELTITKLRREDGKELCSSLGKLTNLHRLFVHSITEAEILDVQHPISPTPPLLQVLYFRGRLEKVPQWVSSLQGLTDIQLVGSGLREDPLKSLRDLSNLGEILLYKAYEGEELCFKAGEFQKLKTLSLVKLQKLKWIRMEKDALPCLQELHMVGCKLVEELPWGIQNLNNLQLLHLFDMGEELIKQLQDEGSEQYQKGAQIAKIAQIGLGNWVNGSWERKVIF